MNIDVEQLKSEREQLKQDLRDVENDQRRVDAELKLLRQKEIRTKRMIEALDTLIDVGTEATPAS